MEMEDIIGAMGLSPAQPPAQPTANTHEETEVKREKLISGVMGGGKYIEKNITVESLNNMSNDEITKEFDKYERRLGAVMVKTLGKSMLEVYSSIASYFLPIKPEKKEKLVDDLNQDPFLDHALNRTCCELYYKYGMYLAPLTASLTTIKYCDFKNSENFNNSNDKNGVYARIEQSDSSNPIGSHSNPIGSFTPPTTSSDSPPEDGN